MNSVYSTKDRANLLIDEKMMSEQFHALAFMHNEENGTIDVKIVCTTSLREHSATGCCIQDH